MSRAIHRLSFNGRLLQRGFWLYIWEIIRPRGPNLYYVGRTGDSSSRNAQSPFNRMGQHLGFAENANMLRRYLRAHHVQPERCSFRLIAHGPILEEATTWDSHCERRDVMAALEQALAEAMVDAGYDVMNTVSSRKSLDAKRFDGVLSAFAKEFPGLVHKGKKVARK